MSRRMYMESTLPNTFRIIYLATKKLFERRKSIIYKNKPRFSIFGIGDYAFAKYKVGISASVPDHQIQLDHANPWLTFQSYLRMILATFSVSAIEHMLSMLMNY